MNGWPFNLSLDEASKFVSGLGPATTGALNNAGKSIGDIIGSGPDQLQQLAEETGISQSILSGIQVTVNALNNIEPVDIGSLAWKPDASELAFSSANEYTCSLYETDIYAIRPDGENYRRVTASPACGGRAGLPAGTVTVPVP